MRFFLTLVFICMYRPSFSQWNVCESVPSFCQWNAQWDPEHSGPLWNNSYRPEYKDSLLRRHTIYETRQSVDEAWKNESKYQNAWDEMGRLLKELSYEATNSGGWLLGGETTYSYDSKGRLLERQYSERSTQKASVRSFTFDSFGQNTEVKYIYTDTEGVSDGWWNKNYWDGRDCKVSASTYVFENDQWIPRDSSVFQSDANCNVEVTEHFIHAQGSWQFNSFFKSEYIFDSYGNMIEENYYNKSESALDWTHTLQFIFEYDITGTHLLVEKIILPNINFTHTTRRAFDDDGRLLEFTRETQYNETGENDLKRWNYNYDIDGNLTSREYLGQRDTTTFTYSEMKYEGDINGNLIRTETYHRYLHNTTTNEVVEETTERLFTYRCDNVLHDLTYTILSSSKFDWLAGSQDRSTFDYYLRPDCYQEDSDSDDIVIFPNPAKNYIHVYYPEALGLTNIRIVDDLGRITYSNRVSLSNYFSADLRAQRAGSYIMILDNGDFSISRRIIIIK